MNTIGIYVPRWLQSSDESDKFFADELFKTIKKSGRYKPLLLNLPKLWIFSQNDAAKFCHKNRLALILQHDSPFFKSDPFVSNARYKKNVSLLESCVPFVNSGKSQEVGHNKIFTIKLLKEKGLPVLDHKIVSSLQDLENHIEEGKHYVVKPPDRGAGTGVKLIRKDGAGHVSYYNGQWHKISIKEKKLKNDASSLNIKYGFSFFKTPLLTLKKIHIDFSYSPMLVEPYFNDDSEGFSSLRCTVIGNQVVEAVKRTNQNNITSNVSSGGTAKKVVLTDYQKEIAIAAKNAIGADYAGVDFLTSGGKSVIGEVNIGPFTLWSKYTGVNVGKILAEYLMEKCDKSLAKSVDKK